MKKIFVFVLAFIVALCPLYLISATASDGFTVKNGVLISYTGTAKTVNIPEDAYYIADCAFKDNKSLASLILHTEVKIIGNEAFLGCTSLSSVIGGEGVTSVGAYAFEGTPFLENSNEDFIMLNNVIIGGKPGTNAVLPDGAAAVAPYAFVNNTEIKSVKLPESVCELGEGAFYGCTSLAAVTATDSLSYIGAMAFEKTAYLDKASGFVTLGDSILIKYKGSSAEVTVADGIKQIGAGAFYSNKTITSVKLSNNVTSLGMRAFMNCTKLSSVELSDNLVMIDKEAFANCTSLKKAEVSKGVKLVGESVFFGCTGITNGLYFADADVPDGLFAGCSKLSNVVLSGDFSKVGDYAFLNCTALKEVSVPDSVINIYDTAFEGCKDVKLSCDENSKAALFSKINGMKYMQCGDANGDGDVNIKDATQIQRAVAKMVTLSDVQRLRAETVYDGDVNIKDATLIQKRLAGITQ